MTVTSPSDDARRLVERSCAAQGIAEEITDEHTLAKIAGIVAGSDPTKIEPSRSAGQQLAA